MALFNSSSPFDIYNINLYWYAVNVWDAALEDNINITIDGHSYQDVYWVNGYDGFYDLELDFAGFNITTDAFGQVTGGIVNFVAEFDLNSSSLLWYAEGISVSAVAIYNAAYTPSNLDEISIVQSALSGNDQILLSPFDDRMSGFAGDDTITGGLGRDTLIGGSGNDTFLDTAAGLNGDTITDFSVGDRIIISDANPTNFAFSLSGSTLNFTGGTLSFGSPLTGTLVATAMVGGGVQLTFGTPSPANEPRNDFNGDGRSDVLLRHDDGTIVEWLGQADGSLASNGAATSWLHPAWDVASTGDFNGDTRDDLLLRHSDGTIVEWLGQANGSFVASGAATSWLHPSWDVVLSGDFNGDTRDDLLLRHSDGTIVEWLGQANGSFAGNAAATTWLHPAWDVASTGDFNGDGEDDLLLRHSDGTIVEWLGQANGSFAGNGAATIWLHPAWNVASVGDFNGDTRDDLLLRHSDGTIVEWLGQANGSFTGNGAATVWLHPAWDVVMSGDFNGDTRDDLLLRHSDGTIVEWLAQANGSFAGNAAATTWVNPQWHLQPDNLL